MIHSNKHNIIVKLLAAISHFIFFGPRALVAQQIGRPLHITSLLNTCQFINILHSVFKKKINTVKVC